MKCLLAVVLLGALAAPGLAQELGDAPEHGVARISFLKGDVTIRRGDTGELVAAELNAPLVALDHLITDENSWAEIQLDWANFVRIASFSEVRLAELSDRDFLVQVATGTVTFRVLRDTNSQLEISTPTVAIRPRQQGTYRVRVRDDSSTELTVRSGEVEIFSGQRTDYVRGGQTLIVSGDPSDPQRSYRSAFPRDEWDQWNESRDRDLERSDSYKYISSDIYGAEDLYGHGRWVYDSPYGWVWAPVVDVSWAPYRVGRWSWVNYYGWTWVSGDPWGWAPYHYGRWYHAPRYGWVWYPGETRVRYYWRPALVGFFGWGTNVGWVSLAPYEVYRPWYGPGRVFANNVTVVHDVNVFNNYRNARFVSGRSGVTSIVSGDFGRRKVTINNFVVGKDSDFRRAGDAGRWLGREPSRENRQFSDRPVSPRVNSRPQVDRRFVSTRPDRNDRNRRDDVQRVEMRSPRTTTPAQQGPTNENARRADAPQRNDTPVSPRVEPQSPRQEGNRGRGEGGAGVAAATRGTSNRETPQRSEAFPVPQSEPERARPQGNRGRAENPLGVVAATPETARTPEEQTPRQGNRGRNENPIGVAVGAPSPENARRAEAPERNEPVVFPRNEQQRERQQGNRGRNENPIGVAVGAPTPANARRAEAPERNEPIVFPRNEQQRERQQGNRGRNENQTGVATAAPPQRNEAVVLPRNDSERVRQGENGRGRSEAFARRENEAPRPSQAPETFRRAEPAARTTAPDTAPFRNTPARARPEEVQRPQVFESRPSRAPERQSAPRTESRSDASPPQASAPAPAAQSAPSPSSQQGNSGGRGRGRR